MEIIYNIYRRKFSEYIGENFNDLNSYQYIIDRTKSPYDNITIGMAFKALQSENIEIPSYILNNYKGKKCNINLNLCKLI